VATEFALQDFECGSAAGHSSARSRYLDRLDELHAAGVLLRTLLDTLVTNADEMRREVAAGRRIFDAVSAVSDEASRDFRRDLHAATRRFERAMQATRGESFRILIQEGGRTVTEVARAAELSVQMVKRLLATVDTIGPDHKP